MKQKPILFVYTNDEQSESKIKGENSISKNTKKNKMPSNKFSKEIQELKAKI